ncbi:hypothetical protein H0H92_002315 [Tricholoma furcatifolium]|nr:hypothetical protein H0H92_002315 [Tricholoma furcatifolium]
MSDEDDSSGWQLTESDPGVFTELLKTLGVPMIVDDLYSLDSETLASLQPLHALIFLFKWIPPSATNSSAGQDDRDFPGFFAHQTVNNACATLAVLNALGNIPSLTTGPQLAELNNFTVGMDPQTRGMVITSADWLREAHNALSPPSAVSLDGLGLPRKSEDAYHFVVYLPVLGAVYELDGLKEFPVRHGSYTESGEGWLRTARLLALRDDPLPSLQARLHELQSSGQSAAASEVASLVSRENDKRQRWAFENSLRKHNHVGLIHALLSSLAKGGKLASAQTQARATMQARIEKRRATGEDMDES